MKHAPEKFTVEVVYKLLDSGPTSGLVQTEESTMTKTQTGIQFAAEETPFTDAFETHLEAEHARYLADEDDGDYLDRKSC